MVGRDPVDPGDDSGRGAGAVVAEDAYGDDLRLLRHAVRASGDGGGDVRAVAGAVLGGGVVVDEVVAVRGPPADLLVGDAHAGVEDVDGGAAAPGVRIGPAPASPARSRRHLPARPRPRPGGTRPRTADAARRARPCLRGLPESCRAQLHDDLAAVPVLDAPTVTTVIAWPPHSRLVAVADLVRTATRLRGVDHERR